MDWAVIADFGTAIGTLVLAIATFSATRSATRSARFAERALMEGLRPLLLPSNFGDETQKVHFIDGRWLVVKGGRATMTIDEQAVALVLSVRNVGSGLAVLHGWSIAASPRDAPAAPEDFHRLTRDIYVSTSYVGFVQVAIRDAQSDAYREVVDHVANGEYVLVDVLYGDAEGSQRVITRFSVSKGPAEHPGDEELFINVSRHWNIDLPAPRR
ncbi:hypothetical protein [Humibacter ginsenosidimutans]|uniref:Uncharacterized protein n=1 Tax=Humibacter ginsenosidimutans TaxID=2599293 RepID=A0A5B8M0M6_9MICO|nr:hypothetical protein [Humibacter ginsenosidimutans]QDZ13806.1 hypothetical protein FPZ11_02475 [Humibacter ginsenosidimutans]